MKLLSSLNNSYIDEKRAEDELLNGIMPCLMSNGWDKKGIIFLGGNETILFVSFEDKKEPIIILKKRIINYNKKSKKCKADNKNNYFLCYWN